MTGSASLSSIRSNHLKSRGDAALKAGNLREAWRSYSEALAVTTSTNPARPRMLANRALAFTKAGRYVDALADADAAVAAAPTWDKGHWRRGAALAGLKRGPDAVSAYHRAWQLSKGDIACQKALWGQVQRLTREQLADAIIALLQRLQQEGAVVGAEEEEVLPAELREAWFTVLKAAHRGKPRPGPYYVRYKQWLLHGMPAAEAYCERAAAHTAAKAFLQARADAAAALRLLHLPGTKDSQVSCSTLPEAVAAAELQLGHALAAEPGHADRDPYGAAKAYMRGLEADPRSSTLQGALEEVSRTLTLEQVSQAREELLRSGCTGSAAAPAGTSGGIAPNFRLDITLIFPQASSAALGFKARQYIRQTVAETAGLPLRFITLERVCCSSSEVKQDSKHGLKIEVHMRLGTNKAAGELLMAKPQAAVCEAICSQAVCAALGAPQADALRMHLVNLAAAAEENKALLATDQARAEAERISAQQAERRLIQRPRPKLELALPYGSYRLTRGDGAPLERTDKHPFCMSRVYYDAAERPEEAWAEVSDGSCRWRQTGSEVKVIALRVPAQVPPRDLHVTIEPYTLKVENRRSGEVYLEGELERGVVPAQSVWTHGGGGGEDGCLILLQKMNLELLQRHWMHSEMWWPRLFAGGPAIEWDDYEKDYSDLPVPVLAAHQATEAIRGVERQLEAAEKSRREQLQEADDLRKRTRQERLRQLRAAAAKPPPLEALLGSGSEDDGRSPGTSTSTQEH